MTVNLFKLIFSRPRPASKERREYHFADGDDSYQRMLGMNGAIGIKSITPDGKRFRKIIMI
jgi:hypothetical protein